MADMFGSGGGGGSSTVPVYLPPPPPPPTPTAANYALNSGVDPTSSLIGNMGGTKVTGGKGLDTETTTTRKSLLGD